MRPTYAEINLASINHNLREVRRQIGPRSAIMAVVKANAYGHGMIPVANSVLKEKTATSLGVAIVEEGVTLRENGVEVPVLVFTAPLADQLKLYISHNLETTICSLATARVLNRVAGALGRNAVVHIKVDTGMGRIGFAPKEVVAAAVAISKMKNVTIKGLFTHFATSDEWDLAFAQRQLKEFNYVVKALDTMGISIPVKHCANSGAILQMKGTGFDLVRPGIMMYGYRPSEETRGTLSLRPAMTLRARIGFMKDVAPGVSISYGRRYFTKSKTTIASVTAGYADGISRRLTNKTSAIIKGKEYPVVGTICMDQLMIDVGRRHGCKVGDAVTLMGRDGKAEISGWDISNALGTIPYEVCCAISERVPRVYVHG